MCGLGFQVQKCCSTKSVPFTKRKLSTPVSHLGGGSREVGGLITHNETCSFSGVVSKDGLGPNSGSDVIPIYLFHFNSNSSTTIGARYITACLDSDWSEGVLTAATVTNISFVLEMLISKVFSICGRSLCCQSFSVSSQKTKNTKVYSC